jgi:subtilisin-like proprotein convertase family protein
VLLAWSDTATWSVDFTVTVTGATLSTDGRTLTFAAGQAAATITVRPRTDSAAEPTETVTLSALPNAAYGLGSPSSGSISIADAAILPTLSVSDASVVEGRNDSWVNVTVTLSAPSTSTVTVQLRTYDGTATNGLDYRGQVVTLTFAPGETSKVIAIRTLGDRLREANETFTVQLSAPTNAVLGDDIGVVTILDDDGGK